LYGGAVVYELLDDGPRVGHLVLPSELCYRFVWSGKPASTSGYLQKLARWKEEKGIIYNSLVDNMRRVSSSAIAAAGDDDCDRFLDAVNEYARCLDNLGEQTEIEIYSPPHRALSLLAIDSGLVYKPCGAGGGDLGVVMGTGDDSINRFIAQAEEAGYPSIDISIDPKGARTIRSFEC
jgi:phosphomevalonate kinase